jgi:hypothetical protein
MKIIRYRRTAERPDLALWLLDDDGTLIDFSTGYTFQLKIGDPGSTALLTKTLNITGATGAGVEPTGTPNITIGWAAGELDITPGTYELQLTATTASADREFVMPIQIMDVIT